MGANRIRALSLAAASVFGCSTTTNDTDQTFLIPGGWDQNGYWNSTFTPFVPASSPAWSGPGQPYETFNANNHLSLVARASASACAATTAISIRGARFEDGIGIGPRIWLDANQRWLALGESVTYAATLRNDAGWSIPVTITATRLRDLSVQGVASIVSPTYGVTLARDSDCVWQPLGVNQLGPVPMVTTTTARFAAAPGAYAFYKTYYGGQDHTEAVPAKVMVNAGLLQPMPGEVDDFYQTCATGRAVPAATVLFNASYAFSAMTWLDVIGSATLDTGVQMTVPGQRVRVHMLVDNETICRRRGFPGQVVLRLDPPSGNSDPTSIDVIQVDDTAYLGTDKPVTVGHHSLQGTSTMRSSAWLSTSTDPDRNAYHSMKEHNVQVSHVGAVTGRVASWRQAVTVLTATNFMTSAARARVIAAAVTPQTPGGPLPGHLEEPAEQSQTMDTCGNGYCWTETATTCPVDCAPPMTPGGMDGGLVDAPMPDAGVHDAWTAIDAVDGPSPSFDAAP
jgi:hypothetical protein